MSKITFIMTKVLCQIYLTRHDLKHPDATHTSITQAKKK